MNTDEIVAQVAIPGLSTERRYLWVLYNPDVNGLPNLTSPWSVKPFEFDSRDGYAHDFEPPDEEVDLWVSRVQVTPEQCGSWAGAWLERQLARPVRRRERDAPTSGWSTLIPQRRPGTPALIEWTVSDPENVLDLQGDIPWDWLRRRPPTREIWERRDPHPSS